MVDVSTNNRVRRVVAHKNVVAHRTTRSEKKPTPVKTEIQTELATGYFFPHTNMVERIVAEQNVLITQGDRWAQGQKAVFSTVTDSIELSGNPIAEAPEGRITEAEVLIWDRAQNRFKVKELRARGNDLPAINLPTRPRPPSQ